ncbi:ribose-phosphate pyrophosphokinase [Megasphaera cerevisiae DSM 20462]|jgi:ribose-phosphate pyrophosphokinase|uniref:Ribose-phosphate pyrophosphokinase n=1 Tax=Megasphaera cerevisiae DSM 20462 TaxID=1122219 RepID=A0A0J6WRE8_9FIRM|nr:ribose-phosphate pyrophosphokinase [Megasphaera cerevisiae]KMO86010.1 ribose-phosphate pyrophosphokinase [Megasphaera cerevisiae DSM 20462]OKY54577.1 ribose-phosphate pyrophosphokinase [Megasphaera cerevisiae]SKA06005.1 ribose-phosphate pyrophosphokinase [Megasphaera cerevisiae DSM 20462]
MSYEDGKKLKIFTGNANPKLAKEIVDYLGLELGKAFVGKFNNGEIQVLIDESVRGKDVFVIQPTCQPANDTLMELLIMADALKRASAKHITAVVPYYGYARQDRKTRGREPITSKLVADLMTTAGITRVVTMDLHAGQIQGFFDVPVDHLGSASIIAKYLNQKKEEMDMGDIVVVSPDLGGVTRARDLADRINAPIAIIEKRRPRPGVAEVMNVIGDIKGKTCIIIDDIVDTAGSLCGGAKALKELGASRVYAACAHAVLTDPAVDRIKKSVISELIITNTIPLPDEKKIDKIKVLSVAPLLGEAIMRIFHDVSVSRLFDK